MSKMRAHTAILCPQARICPSPQECDQVVENSTLQEEVDLHTSQLGYQ
jgi:hypothetical protein